MSFFLNLLLQQRWHFFTAELPVWCNYSVFLNRLAQNDWLTPETQDKAIVKLNVIKPYIGYPDELPERYSRKVVDEKLTLFENAQKLSQIDIAYSWSKWNQPVDYKEWGMSAHMVDRKSVV